VPLVISFVVGSSGSTTAGCILFGVSMFFALLGMILISTGTGLFLALDFIGFGIVLAVKRQAEWNEQIGGMRVGLGFGSIAAFFIVMLFIYVRPRKEDL
jgi:hypothetical protein